MSVTLQIQLLGDFRLLHNNLPVSALNTVRIQTLLAYLAIHRAAPQARQQLAYLFWPDSSDSQARTNLRNAIFQLRNALPDADDFLQVENQTIHWRPAAPYQLDIADFEAALSAAEAATTSAAKEAALTRAIQAYGGDLLPGVYDDWLLQERERLRQRFLYALDELIALLESQQEHRQAIDYAQRLLQEDPLRESTYAKLMQLHAQGGDRAAALRIYHTCTTTLARELGVDPDPMTRRIYEHLLNLDSPQPTLSRVHDAAPLVGRDADWAQLQQAWRQASRGHPTFVLVHGEAGIGKTRLVEELVEWAQRQGIASASARCYAFGGNLAFAPVQEWLRAPILRRARQELAPMWANEVARLLPELLNERRDLTPPTTAVESWQRQQLFTALARLLLFGGEPILLMLDDVQWCDQETVEWVQHLLSTNPQARLLIVSTQRREEVSTQQVLKPLLQHLNRTGNLVELALRRLSASETGELAASLLGEPLRAEQRAAIYAETEGNPLFVVETVRAGQGGSNAPPAGATDHLPLPPKVQAIIQARLDALSPAAHELACIAAVIGRAFTVAVLAQVSDRDENALVQGLDELWQHRIIQEKQKSTLSAETYDFSHDKIREVAYESLSPIRRRYWHRRTAQTLPQVYAHHLDGVQAQIATHYEAAGEAIAAVDNYLAAAQVALQRSALLEAINYLQRGLTLVDALADKSLRTPRELAIYTALGPLQLATRGYAAPAVETAFTRASELAEQLGDAPQQFQALWGLSRFFLVQPNLTRGLAVAQQLLVLAEQAHDDGLLLEARCALGTHYFHRAAFAEATYYLEQAIAGYDQRRHADHALRFGQDPCVVASAYLAWTCWCLGRPAAAQAHVATARSLAEKIDHPYSQVIALTYACVQEQFRDQPIACLAHAETAIALAEKYGFTLWLSMSTFLRGWAHARQGDFNAGFDDMQRSIELYRSSGAELGAGYFTALLADTFSRSEQHEAALILMPQALALVRRTQDRWCEAEVYRLQGAAYLRAGEKAKGETALQTALEIAQAQGAQQWALRALLSLGRLRQEQDRLAEVAPALATLVAAIGSENPSPDLAAAQALIAQ